MYERPQADEYPEYYRQYAEVVPDGDVLEFLEHQQEAMRQLLGTLNEDQADYKYAAGKWTLKEVLGHIMDTERIFCVRALAFARQDPADLPGFEQDDYVTNGYFPSRTLRDLLEEASTIRAATLSMFHGFDDRSFKRQGRANNAIFSVRSVPWIIAGHARHHLSVIQERYLPQS